MYETIQYESRGRLAVITLNRPGKRNALNHVMVDELKKAFRQAADDETAKVVLLQANGKVFSAGADLAYLQKLQENSFEENLQDSRSLMELYRIIYSHPKVVIARVQGHAIAGGCGLATVCDFSIASTEAQFGYTESRIGFVPAIVMVFLLRKIGEARARNLLLTGKMISASEALQAGLISEVAEPDELNDKVMALANTLLEKTSAESLKRIKTMIAEVQHMPLDEALTYAAWLNAETRSTNDCKKGIAAFLNKQKLSW